MDELKTRSLRIDDGTYAKFEDLAKSFDNKNACISSLLQSYEIELSKTSMPNMRKEIETFQAFVTSIQEAYNNSLKANEQTDARIRVEYNHMIQSKDETIIDLQEKKKILEQIKIEATEESKKLTEEVENYRKEIEELRNQLTTAHIENDKNNDVIKTLMDITTEYKGYAEENKQLQQQNTDFIRKIDELEKLNNSLSEKLEGQVTQHTAELEQIKGILTIEQEKKMLELERQQQRHLQEQQKLYSDKINNYEIKVQSLLEQLEGNKTQPAPKTSPSTNRKTSTSKYKKDTTATERTTEGEQ